MSKKQAPIFAILIAAVLVSGWIRSYIAEPNISYNGIYYISGLKDEVEIYTDAFGTPHVFAKNKEDLFFSAGYLTARERLFQLSVRASAGRGELALMLGDELLADDRYLRTFGIPAVSKEILSETDAETVSLLQVYCNGINAWIDETADRLPIEFKIIGSKPVKWTPVDVIATARLMARELQQSWRTEIVMGALVEKLGSEKAKALFPLDSDDVKIVPQDVSFSSLFQSMKQTEENIRNLLNTNGSVMGSNNMVTSGRLTKSGKPIITNDPHLGTTQPAWWYEMHLKGAGINISGVCLPGMPFPVIGQNEHCAWGFTNVMADDMDFFVEKVHPDNPDLYQHKGEWKSFQIRTETIPLKSGGEQKIKIRETVHGPVISDIHSQLKHAKTVVSMAWTGHHKTNEIKALIDMAYIKNWDDYSKIIEQIGVPGQNIVYADVDGNIGWRPAVKIPIRIEGNSLLPRPGHTGEYDWSGFVPFDEMPYLLNPSSGFIVTANNKTIDDTYPYYISNQFAPPSRAVRFTEMVKAADNITVDDVKRMQMDWLSPQAREISRYFIHARRGNERGNLKIAYDMLAEWDFVEAPQSSAALVYHVAFNRLLENVYGDELSLVGEGILKAFVAMPMVPIRSLLAMLRSGESVWFDDMQTEEVESMQTILRKSMVEAVQEIENDVSRISGRWKWSKVHKVTYRHSLGRVTLLDKLFGFNVGPFPSGGSSATVNKGQYMHLSGYAQRVGPSMRRIVDFADLNSTQFILPTGQSGNPFSKHYKDQAEMFLDGSFKTTHFEEDFIRESHDYQRMVLMPADQ